LTLGGVHVMVVFTLIASWMNPAIALAFASTPSAAASSAVARVCIS